MSARMNISIPDDLKARMDALGESVNWSKIAARAFQDKLDRAHNLSIADLLSGVQAAMDQQSTSVLSPLLKGVEEVRPDLVAPVNELVAPMLDRFLNSEPIPEQLKPWEAKGEWPLSPEGLVQLIRDQIAHYNETVMNPWIGKVVLELVFLQLGAVAAKHKS